ncbi:putative disease resistance protein RGA3 [Morus notabilis]|uniref:putative disease resistance protein RGA3 n=1 Tax=Morus notabilis TaxID=981085 RepID=UPI000CED37ED|nr:putative disease resistance protein RGA3 [Morus notabilis]
MEHLESLTLNWEIRGVANAEAALKNLEPHKDIKAIQVWNYPGETLPDWFSLLTSLVRLELSFCTKLKYLPPLHQLSSLQELKLEFLSALEYVSDRDHLSSSTMSFFQSLTTLKIMECPILHGWWGRGGQTLTGHQPQQQQQPPFPVLSELEISNCPVLNSEPLFPNLETLELDRTSFKPLELKIMSVAASSSSSYSLNLSKLKVLTVHNLEHLEPQLLDALTNSLPSLQSLRI